MSQLIRLLNILIFAAELFMCIRGSWRSGEFVAWMRRVCMMHIMCCWCLCDSHTKPWHQTRQPAHVIATELCVIVTRFKYVSSSTVYTTQFIINPYLLPLIVQTQTTIATILPPVVFITCVYVPVWVSVWFVCACQWVLCMYVCMYAFMYVCVCIRAGRLASVLTDWTTDAINAH